MSTPQTFEVDFEPIGKRVDIAAGISLLDAAQQAGLALSSACGGFGKCGQCQVIVLEGSVSPPTVNETYILTEGELQRGRRLACSTRIHSDVKVHLPKASLITGQRLQIEGDTRRLTFDPAIVAYEIEAPKPTLHDPRSDLERIVAGLTGAQSQADITAEPAVIRQLSTFAREQQWRLTVYLRGAEIVGLGPAGAHPVGMAVDLGTTKIAAYLVDLQSGQELATAGALNPQIGYGEDVISRLTYAHRHADGGPALAGMVRQTLDELLGELIGRAGVTRQQVADICLVGNTAMTHLLLELPVRQLAMSPYVAATGAAVDVKARELGLATAPGAYVHVLPCIGGFVGADHVAMLLASGLDQADHIILGIDIGTNTEIALVNPGAGAIASASCASGPAFEGAHISDGMRAAAGAIEALKLTESGLQLKTIDNAPPVGLCGSGIVDTIAELRRWNLINEGGRFNREHNRLRQGRHGPELLLAPAHQSGSGRDVVITQKDVNEIQLAKGAIRAGLEALLKTTHTAPEAVEEVIVAGAFGSFLDIKSALDIGLFPALPHARYKQVGNAAGAGAKWALLSLAARRRAQQIAGQTRYIELTAFPKFNRLFAAGMLFPNETGQAVPRK
ncbi:MAG: ASKHA domain-containing protein [Anaerolineae bacterium]